MNSARPQLQKITLLAVPFILVLAIPGFAQEITSDASGDVTGKTNDEVRALHLIYQYDKNRDGQLTASEWGEISDLYPDVDTADGNRDGKITAQECASWMQSLSYIKAAYAYEGPLLDESRIENIRLLGKAPAPRYRHDRNIIISWSKNNDELRGFSKNSGEWTPLEIPKQDWINPITINDAAVVQVDNTLAAYSGITGTWDVLQLTNAIEFSMNAGDPAVIEITDDGKLYIFAAANGKWTSPDDPDLGRSNQSSGLKVDPWVRESLELIEGYSLGANFRDAQEDQLRLRISKAVSASFDKRQAYQKSEVARMQQKLKSIQAAITKRETLREQIIARRVDELLDLKPASAVPESPATPSPASP